MKNIIAVFALLGLLFSAVAQKETLDRSQLEKLPAAPDYTSLDMWAAHPEKEDTADETPGKKQLIDGQMNAKVDVFFVYPTIYAGKQNPSNPWNADVYDMSLNEKIDNSTIKNQASVFNGSAKVYAPRYRQAHLQVYYVKDAVIKSTALDYAYEDVKAAFKYYLENYNNNRPFIIASHSQGTSHAARLVKEMIEGTSLQERMVAAYLVGMPLKKDMYEQITPCEEASQTGCWISWNTFREGHFPDHFAVTYDKALSTNPLNWRIDDTYASRDENKGGVLRNFEKITPRVTDAQNYRGVLWAEKPHFFGRILLRTKRYHIADYNLYYVNIRQNIEERVDAFLQSNQ
jgi:hypothetical protein